MLINSFKLIMACKIGLSHEMNTNESRNFLTVLLLSEVFLLMFGLSSSTLTKYIPLEKKSIFKESTGKITVREH